jgi:hypothetical protein
MGFGDVMGFTLHAEHQNASPNITLVTGSAGLHSRVLHQVPYPPCH